MAKSLFSLTFRTLAFCLFLLFSSVVSAAVVDGLFNANVEVRDQQAANREQAFNDALRQVLLKLSGNSELISNESFVKQFYPAEKYVVSFSYKENPAYDQWQAKSASINAQLNGEAVSSPTSNNSSQQIEDTQDKQDQENPPLPLLFQVQFSEQTLERELAMSGMPVWGNIRPTVQIWVALEEQGKRQLLGIQNAHNFLESLKTTADRFALPVIFPEADNVDSDKLSITSLWGLFPDALDAASVRYQADAQVMVRVYKSFSNTWSANWLLIQAGASSSNSIVDSSLSNISKVIIADLARVISDRYAIKRDSFVENNEMTIEVSNISSFKDFIELETFLENITPVKSVGFNWAQGSNLSVRLRLNSTQSQFIEYINLSGKLKHVGSASLTLNKTEEGHVGFLDPESGLLMPNVEQFEWLSSASASKVDVR